MTTPKNCDLYAPFCGEAYIYWYRREKEQKYAVLLAPDRSYLNSSLNMIMASQSKN